jgi:hypothetical protein
MPNFAVRTVDGGEYRFTHQADLDALVKELATAGHVAVTISFDSRDRSVGARQAVLFREGIVSIARL